MNKEFLHMQKLAGIISEGEYKARLNEIKINQPSPLNYLLNLQSKIEATEDPKEKLSLATQCAERVLFIWEEKYPNDDRPRKAIEAAKTCLENPTEENKKAAAIAGRAANIAATDANDDAAAYAAVGYDADDDGDYGEGYDEYIDEYIDAAAEAAYAAYTVAEAANSNHPSYASTSARNAISAVKEYYNGDEYKAKMNKESTNNIEDLLQLAEFLNEIETKKALATKFKKEIIEYLKDYYENHYDDLGNDLSSDEIENNWMELWMGDAEIFFMVDDSLEDEPIVRVNWDRDEDVDMSRYARFYNEPYNSSNRSVNILNKKVWYSYL